MYCISYGKRENEQRDNYIELNAVFHGSDGSAVQIELDRVKNMMDSDGPGLVESVVWFCVCLQLSEDVLSTSESRLG